MHQHTTILGTLAYKSNWTTATGGKSYRRNIAIDIHHIVNKTVALFCSMISKVSRFVDESWAFSHTLLLVIEIFHIQSIYCPEEGELIA